MHSRALLFSLLVLTAPAAAAEVDVADWGFADPAGSVVFRGADGLARLIESTEARYGDSAYVKRAAATLRAWRTEGVGPAVGIWPGGLALGRGIGGFAGPDGRFRFVVGADDPAAARATLGGWFGAFEVPLRLTDRGFAGDSVEFICGGVAGFLVCDSAKLPAKPPGRPEGLSPDAVMEIVLGPAAIAASGSALPIQSARMRMVSESDGARLTVDAEIAPHGQPLMAMFGDPEGDSRGLGTVDRRSAGVLKLSVDGPKVLAAIEAGMGGPPPTIKALWSALSGSWSGDIVLSFAPGFLQPVFALGLQPGQDGRAIIDGLSNALANAGAKVSDDKGVWRVEMLFDDADDDPLVLKLRHRTLDDALIFALSAAELDRIEEGRTLPAILPPDVRRRGTHGVWMTGLSAGFGPVTDDFIEAGPNTAGVGAIIDLLWAQSARLDSGSVTVRVTETALRLELDWRLL